MKHDWGYYKNLSALVLIVSGCALLIEHIARYGQTDFGDILGHETYGLVMVIAGFLLVLTRKKKDNRWFPVVNGKDMKKITEQENKMKKLELIGKVGTRTKNTIQYHKRSGHPKIHANKAGKRYIMVRKVGGGVKRLYEGSEYKVEGA